MSLYHFDEDRTRLEVNFITAQVEDSLTFAERNSIKVLDLACGQGRHSIGCAEHGFEVVGLDFQQVLLDIAKLKKEEAKVKNLSFVRGDMKDLPYTNEFNAVLNLFTAFGYFSDLENEGVIGQVEKALCPGGVFVQDLSNKKYQISNTKEKWQRITRDGLTVDNEWRFYAETDRYTHKQWLRKKDGTVREFCHTVRIYTLDEIKDIYKKHKMTLKNVFGDYKSSVYDEEKSPRMILVSKKEG